MLRPPVIRPRSSPAAWDRLVLCVLLLAGLLCHPAPAADTGAGAATADRQSEAAAAERRLDESVRFLASDELEGRGLGTPGLDRAADYLAAQFRELGLKTDSFPGAPFQEFQTTISSKLGPPERNHLAFELPPQPDGAASPAPAPLKLGIDFTPLRDSGSAEFDLPLVFAGYGITSPDDHYDDYAQIDAKGKAVIILRHEPQQSNPHGPFDGQRDSRHAPIMRKISNAYQHGAQAVILVTDEVEIKKKVAERSQQLHTAIDNLAKANEEFRQQKSPSFEQIEERRRQLETLADQVKSASQKLAQEYDPLFDFNRGGDASDRRNFPVLHCRRAVIDPLLKAAAGASLAELERQIDEDLKPRSLELAGCRVRGQTDVQRVEARVKNVVAVLEGEGSLADETIIVGAHYDHLGRGESGTLAVGSNDIHNGADDNGSGTAALLEIARTVTQSGKKLPRRVVFIGFTGEERGLLGSAHYVHHPIIPLDKTVAMFNLDMVGRMKDDELVVYGTGTARQFDPLLDKLNSTFGFKLKREPGGFGPSDHSSFYAVNIPVLHFFTGLHNDYHRPTDDANKINVSGMRRVAELVAQTVLDVAQAEMRPEFTKAQRESFGRPGGQPAGDRPYFGSVPDLGGEANGYALQGVTPGGPADKAGIRGGDIIIQLGDNKIGNLADFDTALRKFKAGDKVPVTVQRGGAEVKVEVTLEPPK